MKLPAPIQSSLLSNGQTKAEGNAAHGFFTRIGGHSTGIYDALNTGLGSKDSPETVTKNRQLVAACLSVTPENLLTAYQCHSPDVVTVTAPWSDAKRPQADSMVTRTPGIALGILTADCGPVLFHDPQNGVIGAAHAGWKGATGGVLENTVCKMEKLGASRTAIHAVLGPTISAKNYEVGPEFVEMLNKLDPDNTTYLTPSPNAGHAMFDLPAYTLARLQKIGVNTGWTGDCTYENETSFYSYRRTTHRGEPDYGRQISAITLGSEPTTQRSGT